MDGDGPARGARARNCRAGSRARNDRPCLSGQVSKAEDSPLTRLHLHLRVVVGAARKRRAVSPPRKGLGLDNYLDGTLCLHCAWQTWFKKQRFERWCRARERASVLSFTKRYAK
jgi:hypothetical protein